MELIFTDVTEFARWREAYIAAKGENPKTRARIHNGRFEYRLFVTI